MKSKIHNQIKIFNYIVSTERFKIIFIMTIALALYGGFVLGESAENFIDCIILTFQFFMFNIFMFALLFLNTLNTCSTFTKDFANYIIRLKTKKTYVKELLKNSIVLNLFHLLIFLILYFTILNFKRFGFFGIHNYNNYEINNLIYMIFYVFRYVIYAVLITIVSALIFVNFKDKITMLLNSIFLVGFGMHSFDVTIKNYFSFNIWDYFNETYYSSFMTELSSSILFLLIIEIIIMIVYKVTIKNKKMVIT
ncbi:MAG: hypothetical protein NC181_03655 [Clostridium sp.]|nr:hypothetical protein [Clostridium sp.]MCM1444592.1 hypothetical protein [Candidatus Amulumruptor caecigallinarius]